VRDCETEALCDPHSKRCNLPVCEPGQRRCERDGKLRRCAEGRHEWQLETDCAAAAGGALQGFQSGLCDLTQGCLPEATCVNGSFRCNGAELERCLQDFWFPYARCASSALCNPSGVCNPPVCEAGEGRCVTPGAEPTVARPGEPTLGLTLEVCNPGGTGFETVRDCAPDELCDGTHRQCDLCDPLEPVCFQEKLHQCSADGQEREPERDCPGGCNVVAGVPTCLPVGN
jgi:hypothetical protein